MSKLPLDILKDARAYLEKPGAWVQHAGSETDNTACAITAIHRVCGESWKNGNYAENALYAALKKIPNDAGGWPSVYNDQPGRKLEDILAMYDAAIDIEKRRGWWEQFFLGLGLDGLVKRER